MTERDIADTYVIKEALLNSKPCAETQKNKLLEDSENNITFNEIDAPRLASKKLILNLNKKSDQALSYLKYLYNSIKLSKPKPIKGINRTFTQQQTMTDKSRIYDSLEKISVERIKLNSCFKAESKEFKNLYIKKVSYIDDIEKPFSSLVRKQYTDETGKTSDNTVLINNANSRFSENSGSEEDYSSHEDKENLKNDIFKFKNLNTSKNQSMQEKLETKRDFNIKSLKVKGSNIDKIESILKLQQIGKEKTHQLNLNESFESSKYSGSNSDFSLSVKNNKKRSTKTLVDCYNNVKLKTKDIIGNECLSPTTPDEDFTPINLQENFPLLYKLSSSKSTKGIKI